MSKDANWQPKHIPYEVDPTNRGHFYENYWKQKALSLLLKHYPAAPAKTVLDYGCGRGEAIRIFREAGYSVTGTDTDPKCVELARQYGPTQVLNPDDPVNQFGEKSFDVVATFHVLEHVDNPKRTLNQLAAIAREYVLVAVPNLRHLHGISAKNIDLQIINEGHLHGWNHLHFLNLAERHCGLKLVEWGFDATILPIFSNISSRLFGNKTTIALETGLFQKLFPYHGISIIGLFRVPPRNTAKP